MNTVHNAVFDPALGPDGGWRSLRTTDLSGGGGGGGGLTNTELRASPVPMKPVLTAGGNISVDLTAGDDSVIPSQACTQVTIANPDTDDIVNVIQGGVAFPVFPRSYVSFFGITNANQLTLNCPASAVTVGVRWES